MEAKHPFLLRYSVLCGWVPRSQPLPEGRGLQKDLSIRRQGSSWKSAFYGCLPPHSLNPKVKQLRAGVEQEGTGTLLLRKFVQDPLTVFRLFIYVGPVSVAWCWLPSRDLSLDLSPLASNVMVMTRRGKHGGCPRAHGGFFSFVLGGYTLPAFVTFKAQWQPGCVNFLLKYASVSVLPTTDCQCLER